jgi:citrate lyase subunit beta/citryl-CoA lyase
MDKAGGVGADAIILDLEDAVAAEARPAARKLAAGYLQDRDDVWIRVNPVDTEDSVADLDAVMSGAPVGIILPKARSAADAVKLAERIDKLEAQHGIEQGSTLIMAICTERPEALFTLNSYMGATSRLYGLSWGAEDLAAAVGANTNRDDAGKWLPQYEMARSMCLFAAAAAEVAAIDTVYTDFRDLDGLLGYASTARRDGFSGMLAIHPAQVEVINAAFEPTEAELEQAERIIRVFDENPGAGTVSLDGKMVDRPHLIQAQRLLQGKRK